MNKKKAFDDIEEFLMENGIEFEEGVSRRTLLVEVGRVIHWFQFTDLSILVASSVLIDGEDIGISHINIGYEDIQELCFIDGNLWIKGKGVLDYTIIYFKDYKRR